MMMIVFIALAFFACSSSYKVGYNTFLLHGRIKSQLRALDVHVVEKLENIRNKYLLLENVVEPEAMVEAESLKEVAEMYRSYLDVKKMIGKFRTMYKNETSVTRKEKQLKSLLSLYNGTLEAERLLSEKVGIPIAVAGHARPEGMAELEAMNRRVEELEAKLEKVKVKIPEVKEDR